MYPWSLLYRLQWSGGYVELSFLLIVRWSMIFDTISLDTGYMPHSRIPHFSLVPDEPLSSDCCRTQDDLVHEAVMTKAIEEMYIGTCWNDDKAVVVSAQCTLCRIDMLRSC